MDTARMIQEKRQLMKLRKHRWNADDVVVKVSNGFGGFEDIVVRNTFQKVRLGDLDYMRYRIVQPKGYEREEIIHRVGQNREGLICSVIMTLATANGRVQNR
jgi:hypothetical protein